MTYNIKCPVCNNILTITIEEIQCNGYVRYMTEIVEGCSHVAEEKIPNNASNKYRQLCDLIKSFYTDVDLQYNKLKKIEMLKKAEQLGIDINSLTGR